jgi:hypothetical protein
VECSTPHEPLNRCSLGNLPAIALTWCGLTSHGRRSPNSLFMSLAAHDSEFRRWSGGVDRRTCQTFAASPAEPGELPLGFRIPLIRSERIARRGCEYQKTRDRHRAKGSSDGLEVDHAFLFLSFCLILPLAKHGIGDSDGLNAGRNSAIRMVWARRKPPVCRALTPFCAPGSSYPRRLAPTGEGYVKQSRTTQEIKCGVEMR